MIADALSAPLGQNKPPKSRFVLVVSMRQLLIGMLAVLMIAAAGWTLFGASLRDRQASAVAPATNSDTATSGKPEPATLTTQEHSTSAPPQSATPIKAPVKTITIIDGTSGKRQEIVIPDTGETGSISDTGESPKPAKPRSSSQRAPR